MFWLGWQGARRMCGAPRGPRPGIEGLGPFSSALAAPGVSWRPSRIRGDVVPGRHEAPKDSDPLIGLVVLGLMVLLAVTIILAVI